MRLRDQLFNSAGKTNAWLTPRGSPSR